MGAVVAVLAAVADVRGAIGFSAFAVLVYYAIANASAMTLGRKVIPAAGLADACCWPSLLPIGSVLVGVAVWCSSRGARLRWSAGDNTRRDPAMT